MGNPSTEDLKVLNGNLKRSNTLVTELITINCEDLTLEVFLRKAEIKEEFADFTVVQVSSLEEAKLVAKLHKQIPGWTVQINVDIRVVGQERDDIHGYCLDEGIPYMNM